MLRPVLILHLMLAAAFTIFMTSYFDKLYNTPACNHLAGCNFTSKPDNSSADHHDLTRTIDCPVKTCQGDEWCCEVCTAQKGNRWAESIVQATSTRVFPDPTWAILTVFGIDTLLFIIIFILNYTTIKKLNQAETYEEETPRFVGYKTRVFIGLVIVGIFVSVVAIGIYLGIAMITDMNFYRDCHSGLTITISWMVLCAVCFIDAGLRVVPAITNKVKKNQAVKEALLVVDQGESAKRLMAAEKIKTKAPTCLNKIIDWPLNILLLWWVVVCIYFIGVGEGRWSPIF